MLKKKTNAERKWIERSSILGPLLWGGAKKLQIRNWGGRKEHLLWAAFLSLGLRGCRGTLIPPVTCLGVRRPKDQALDWQGMGGPHWNGLVHCPAGHESVAEQLPWKAGQCKVPFFFFPVFLRSQACFSLICCLLYYYEIVISHSFMG